MNRVSMRSLVRMAAAFGFATAIVATGASAAGRAAAAVSATPGSTASVAASATDAAACVVVLDCAGATQKTTCDADGKFTFHDVPAGACTVSAMDSAAPQNAAVTSPRDASSGMATGKRMHKPVSFQVSLDGAPTAAARAAAADGAAPSSVSVMFQERRKELTGHVTLIK